MKKILLSLVICLITILSCNTSTQKYTMRPISNFMKKRVPEKRQSTIAYDIKGISKEGAEANATYLGNEIKSCKINIYGEADHTELIYDFEANQILVIEKKQIYANTKATTSGNSVVEKRVNFIIGYDGKYIKKPNKDNEFDHFYLEMKKVVPFKIL